MSKVNFGFGSENDMKFSEFCEDIATKTQDEILNYPFFINMALGILDIEKFKMFIQQDHNYLDNLHKVFEIAAKKEEDLELNAILVKYSKGTSSIKLFNSYYEEFGFERTDVSLSGTLNYTNALLTTAKQELPAVIFAATFPCFYVWHKLGNHLQKIAGSELEINQYKRFIQAIGGSPEYTGLAKASKVVDNYWKKSEEEVKLKMVKAFEDSVEYEYRFVDALYMYKS